MIVRFFPKKIFSASKTSPGKRNYLHLIYPLHLHLEFRAVLDFVLCWKLVHFKMPYMQFLFVRPRFCLRLLSDSASRRTPLSLANSSYRQACSGLSPPSYYACRAHNKSSRRLTISWTASYSIAVINLFSTILLIVDICNNSHTYKHLVELF